MEEIAELEARKEQILKEMREMRAMRKGSVTEQYIRVKKKGKKEPTFYGPYFLYTRKKEGKSVGERLSQEQANLYREEVEVFHRFQSLCNEYAELSERLGELERGLGESSPEKKLRRSRSRRTKK